MPRNCLQPVKGTKIRVRGLVRTSFGVSARVRIMELAQFHGVCHDVHSNFFNVLVSS